MCALHWIKVREGPQKGRFGFMASFTFSTFSSHGNVQFLSSFPLFFSLLPHTSYLTTLPTPLPTLIMPCSKTSTIAATVGVVLVSAYFLDASRLPVVGGLFKKKKNNDTNSNTASTSTKTTTTTTTTTTTKTVAVKCMQYLQEDVVHHSAGQTMRVIYTGSWILTSPHLLLLFD